MREVFIEVYREFSARQLLTSGFANSSSAGHALAVIGLYTLHDTFDTRKVWSAKSVMKRLFSFHTGTHNWLSEGAQYAVICKNPRKSVQTPN